MSKSRKKRKPTPKKRSRSKPDYLSHDGHGVTRYGRALFWVTSASRRSLMHLVDLEPVEAPKGGLWPAVCTCEAWIYGDRPCRHIRAVLEMILSPVIHEQEEMIHAINLVALRFHFYRKFDEPTAPTNQDRLPASLYRHAA
jgi:hypothetical protein